IYKNKYFDPSTFSLEVKTYVANEAKDNPFEAKETHKTEDIDFVTFKKKNLLKVGDRDYSGDWTTRYPSIVCHKLVDVSVKSAFLGWVAGEIEKFFKGFLVNIQQQIIETYDEWKDLTEEEIST